MAGLSGSGTGERQDTHWVANPQGGAGNLGTPPGGGPSAGIWCGTGSAYTRTVTSQVLGDGGVGGTPGTGGNAREAHLPVRGDGQAFRKRLSAALLSWKLQIGDSPAVC